MGKHLIIGSGEIGKSVGKVLKDVCEIRMRDIGDGIIGDFDVIHICYGFTDKRSFVKSVREYIDMYNPRIVVVHSTVGIGTIRSLGKIAVHVPIRGKHPNLAESIKTFRLYVGGLDGERVQEVVDLFTSAGCDVTSLEGEKPETTELMKLMCTTYYGWNILFEKEIHSLCQKMGLDFNLVYTDFNNTYNDGYNQMGMPQFVRPVLTHIPGKIQGHCVVPNTKIFKDSYITRLIAKKDEEFERTNG